MAKENKWLGHGARLLAVAMIVAGVVIGNAAHADTFFSETENANKHQKTAAINDLNGAVDWLLDQTRGKSALVPDIFDGFTQKKAGIDRPSWKAGREGRSYGGRLRAGPGLDFPQVGNLSEGAPVTLIRNTGISMHGYDWFLVDLEGRYQWGGLLCSVGRHIPGVYAMCD